MREAKTKPENSGVGKDVVALGKAKEGATFAALSAAMGEWSQHLSDGGSNATIFHWYPVHGGGGEEYSFKWLEAHENLAELGAD